MKKQNQSQEEFERIESYLTGSMNREEQSVFEESLKADEPLRQQVKEVRVLLLAVEEKVLRNKLDEFHEEISNGSTTEKSVRPYIMYFVAASVALLIGLGIWLLASQKTSNEKLFAQYFKPDPGMITPMSTTSDYEFYRGMVDYKQGKYQPAINRWNTLLNHKPNNDTLNYFMGVSYLAGGDDKKAIAYLSKAVNYPNSVFINEAWYYLGLTYLKEGHLGKAIHAFKKSNLEKSKLILNEMGSVK